MKKLFTRSMNEKENNVSGNKGWVVEGPRKETLDFLQQFARICHSESGLNPKLRVLILN